MATTWFEDLTGFQELPYEETRRNLEVAGKMLRSRINNRSTRSVSWKSHR